MRGRPRDTDPLLEALRRRNAGIRAIRYRENRTVLLSRSRDGRTLNSHVCFRSAPPEVVAAIAAFVTARRGSRQAREALARIRGWDGTRRGLERARRRKPPARRTAPDGPETEPLRALFHRYNQRRFGGRLPHIPLRISRRMTRSLGTIRYTGGRERGVREIAISADLLLPGNREILEDTLLHEMAHAEAWLLHGHRGHGRIWRRIAARVGCTPRALSRARVHGRRRCS